jgi:hypothetical protein
MYTNSATPNTTKKREGQKRPKSRGRGKVREDGGDHRSSSNKRRVWDRIMSMRRKAAIKRDWVKGSLPAPDLRNVH